MRVASPVQPKVRPPLTTAVAAATDVRPTTTQTSAGTMVPEFRGPVGKSTDRRRGDPVRRQATASMLSVRTGGSSKVSPLGAGGDALGHLSPVERDQLGQPKALRGGKASASRHPPAELWPQVRQHLLDRSLKSNPKLNPALTAYTPGETLALLKHPEIQEWHEQMSEHRLPEDCHTVVLVPCAKTKPWDEASTRRSQLYSAYHAVRKQVEAGERPGVLFVTISEPLGVVPESHWSDFPQYDNPGLFPDDAQRSGMFTRDWNEAFGERFIVPFDRDAQQACLTQLGDVVGAFLQKNDRGERRFIAFVDDATGTPTTHGAMLDRATSAFGVTIERHPKRSQPRASPQADIERVLDRNG